MARPADEPGVLGVGMARRVKLIEFCLRRSLTFGVQHISSTATRAFPAHEPDIRNVLALGGTTKIPASIAQLLLQVRNVFRDRLDTRSNPVEAFEPGCDFLHPCKEPMINAGTVCSPQFLNPAWAVFPFMSE